MNHRAIAALFLAAPALQSIQMAPADYVRKIGEHRERLIQMASITRLEFGAEFGSLSQKLVESYLDLHDQPKLQSIEALSSYGYTNKKSIAHRLSSIYGKNLRSLSIAQKQELLETIRALNEIESAQKLSYFETNDVSESDQKRLKWLERIVDVTDTGVARAEEMGVVRSPYDGSLFLVRHDRDERGALISRWIEDHFPA